MIRRIQAELITIGDEILYGQTLDTNAHWISGELDKHSIKVIRRSTCGDDEAEIIRLLGEASERADIILITGGLGPTSDDLTKPCLAKFFNCDIALNEKALAELEAYMTSRGRELNKLTRLQAYLPVKSEMISNDCGTAAGIWFHENEKVFVSMPGVPFEMKHMMTHHIIPKLKRTFELPVIYHKNVRVAGIGESWLAEKIEDWEKALPTHIKLAYLPTYSDLKLRLTAFGDNRQELMTEVDRQIEKLLPLIRDYHYGFGEDALEVVIGKILRKNDKKIAVAESCTGGYLGHKITSVPGSSDYYLGGVIAYNNSIKKQLLGVKPEILEEHGAVSEQTVTAMATGALNLFDTDFALATSGIAGPGGGTDEKPVGTIWIACADRLGNLVTKKLQLTREREANTRITTIAALHMLYQSLPKTAG